MFVQQNYFKTSFIMAKNFTKTLSWDDFKALQKGKFDTFAEVSEKINKLAVEYNQARSELINEFLNKRDKFLFVYEHLPNDDGTDMPISERTELMKTAEHWYISVVIGKNELILSFTKDNKTISTMPISFNDFRAFIEREDY